ncbi:tellurite resistance/C4-dicarboxylate transporter family protein [Streptomyces kanamyceticus]|uniref:tellurite resistance/C4-dicarboxylate transporter family protein n=1 Tax=Streptomyces kanamyceticus TaxID=1967 RepID=UPI0012FEFA39|nr:tellurite resistance/C4-dicarboxylate transporter family protein [Streptomyces kanamyceticus]
MPRLPPAERCRDLPPACFAPVMATGIVARALNEAHAVTVGKALFVAAALLHTALLAGLAVKAVRHTDRLLAELRDPARAFGHFTLVAACGVLAARLGAGQLRAVAYGLLVLAAAAWAVIAAHVVAGLRRALRSALPRADGTWFLAVVGLQSIGLAFVAVDPRPLPVAVSLVLWAGGVLLYVTVLAAVAWRLGCHPPGPQLLTPAYWVTMGAVAISTLCGTQLAVHTEALPGPVTGLVTAAVTVLWGWATLLVPPLIAAGAWRHLRHRVRSGGEPALWCIVFPLGMYTTATARLAAARGYAFLSDAVQPMAWTALAAWLVITASRLRARWSADRTRRRGGRSVRTASHQLRTSARSRAVASGASTGKWWLPRSTSTMSKRSP